MKMWDTDQVKKHFLINCDGDADNQNNRGGSFVVIDDDDDDDGSC